MLHCAGCGDALPGAVFHQSTWGTRCDVYWSRFRACSQVCRAKMGEPCFSLSGTIVDGRPDAVRTYLNGPHKARKLRTRRKPYTSAPLAK